MITLPLVFLVYIGIAKMEADDKPWFISVTAVHRLKRAGLMQYCIGR